MSFAYAREDELERGINYAFEKFGCTIMRTSMRRIADRFQELRHIDKLSFSDAMTKVMDERGYTGDVRTWYKAALGKTFNVRALKMHKGKTKLNRKPKPQPVQTASRIPTVLEGNQFAFSLDAITRH